VEGVTWAKGTRKGTKRHCSQHERSVSLLRSTTFEEVTSKAARKGLRDGVMGGERSPRKGGHGFTDKNGMGSFG